MLRSGCVDFPAAEIIRLLIRSDSQSIQQKEQTPSKRKVRRLDGPDTGSEQELPMSRIARSLFVLSLTSALTQFSPSAIAQNLYAALHGTIEDKTGSVIPNATVTVLNTSTGITTVKTTDSNGYYIFTQLQVGGPYTVTVAAQGFENFAQSGLTLNVNDNREVDAKMQIGATAQTVEVSATAVQVETSNTQLQQIATSAQLEGLPLEGRDPTGVQKLAPGVMESSDRFGSYSSNGSQTPQNNYLVNGADINDGALQDAGISVNPDALQEVNIVSSTLNPEFARNSGAVVNMVLKSGANQFHGSGFEFYRDTFLNNGNYFSPVNDAGEKERPDFHQNLYGGTLGGPVFKNKLFFFAAYQGLRNRTATTESSGTLFDANFLGDFTADPNYSTGDVNSNGLTSNPIPFAFGDCAAGEAWSDCFASGSVIIPPALWDSIARNMVTKYVPAGNAGDGNYSFNSPSTAAQDQGILRLDWTPTAKDAIWGSTIFQSSPSEDALSFGGGTLPGFGQHASEHIKIFSAAYTHTFSANMLNELRGGYYRLNYPSVIPSPVQAPSDLGFQITPQLPQSGIPYISVGSAFALGNSYEGPQPRTDTNLTYADNFTWVRGGHSLKLGGLYEQFRVHNPFGYLNNGSYSYNGGGLYSSGDPLIDFVLGIPDSYEQANDGLIDAVASETYAYAQDNWKVSPDLTFNYGIAWDVEQPNQNKQFDGLGVICFQVTDQQSVVYPGGPPGMFWKGDPGCNEAGGPTTHYNRFGPRIGFAWSPTNGMEKIVGVQGAHSLSIRGGFGVYYNRDQEEQSLQNLVDPPVFYTSRGATDFGGSPGFANPFADVAGGGEEPNPFPFTPPSPGGAVDWTLYNTLSLSAFSSNYTVPYTYNFNLNVQRAVGGNVIVQVGYVGSVSHRLPSWHEADPITSAGHDACLADPVCSTQLATQIHLYYPQYAAQPAVVPGTENGAIPGFPNGLPWYLSIGAQDTAGNSNYNSLQASVIKAPTRGLQFTLGYTYSHALDDGSGYESSTGGDSNYGNAGRVRNYVPGFEYLNYGSSDFDARHRLVASYVYSLPAYGKARSNALMRALLAGWGISGVTAVQSGFPVAVSMGTQRSLWCDSFSYFGCPDNPETSSFNIKHYNPRDTPSHVYFDTTPFSEEPLGTFGNTPRNFFRGPGFNYTNLSITKNVVLSGDGRRYVQLRLEGFNAFNHANFQPPINNFSSSRFGWVTNTIHSADPNSDPSPGRSVQLAGKFFF
jgi:Carboxypeptidase regulatory-like domain